MTDIYSEIKSKIRAMQGKNGPVAFIAKVESTDGDACTCSIGELKLTDVRLRAVVNGEESQLLVTPKKGSYVTLLDLSGGDMRQMEAIAFSEIEKIEIKTSGDIAIDCDGTITLNGGDNNGLVKIKELTQKLNELVQKFNTHTHSIPALNVSLAPSPSTATGTTAVPNGTASTFDQNYYENTKIRH